MNFLWWRRKDGAKETVLEEAERLIRQSKRRSLGAFWLDLLLIGGVIGVGYAVWNAMSAPCNAIVVVNDLRKGEPIKAEDIAYAPLRVSSRNVTRGQKLDAFVAARDVAAGSPLLSRDLAERRPRAAAGDVELPLKIFVGKTPPAVGDPVMLGVVGRERGGPIVIAARVLAIDASADPASVTVATGRREAILFSAIPQPQIQLMERNR